MNLFRFLVPAPYKRKAFEKSKAFFVAWRLAGCVEIVTDPIRLVAAAR